MLLLRELAEGTRHLLLVSLEATSAEAAASREACIEATEGVTTSVHRLILVLLLLLKHHLHVLLLSVHHRHATHVLHGVCLHHLGLSRHEAVEVRHELRLSLNWSLRGLLLSVADLNWLLWC